MRYLKYISVFLLGFLVAKLVYDKKPKINEQNEIQVITNGINNLSKLVVSEGSFSEIYTYSDSKKYLYDLVSFDKKAIMSVNAKVEVGYDLSKLQIELDSIKKQIIIKKIPDPSITVIPDIKYFDLQESRFNNFSSKELNKLNKSSVEKIKQTAEVVQLKQRAENRLFEELSKVYQLSKVFGWQVVNRTSSDKLNSLFYLKN